jgi:hypothetical protein
MYPFLHHFLSAKAARTALQAQERPPPNCQEIRLRCTDRNTDALARRLTMEKLYEVRRLHNSPMASRTGNHPANKTAFDW